MENIASISKHVSVLTTVYHLKHVFAVTGAVGCSDAMFVIKEVGAGNAWRVKDDTRGDVVGESSLEVNSEVPKGFNIVTDRKDNVDGVGIENG